MFIPFLKKVQNSEFLNLKLAIFKITIEIVTSYDYELYEYFLVKLNLINEIKLIWDFSLE